MPKDDILALFASDFPEGHQIALAAAIIAACSDSAASVKKRYQPPFPISHVLGQDRYYDIQHRLLGLNLDGVVGKSERHPHGTTSFTSLETARVRITTRKVATRKEPSPPTLFRLQEQALQLSFEFSKLVCEIQIVIPKDSIDRPKSLDVCFPDGDGGYRDEFIDLLALLNKPVPVEIIPDDRDTVARPKHDVRESRKTAGA